MYVINLCVYKNGPVILDVCLVRALDCRAGNQGFEHWYRVLCYALLVTQMM